MVSIIFPTDDTKLSFLVRGGARMLLLHTRTFWLEMLCWTYVSSPMTMSSRKSRPWMIYCWRNGETYIIFFALWSLKRACGTQCAHILGNYNCIIILDRLQSSVSSFTVTHLLSKIARSTLVLFLPYVLSWVYYSALRHWLSLVWLGILHTILPHADNSSHCHHRLPPTGYEF